MEKKWNWRLFSNKSSRICLKGFKSGYSVQVFKIKRMKKNRMQVDFRGMPAVIFSNPTCWHVKCLIEKIEQIKKNINQLIKQIEKIPRNSKIFQENIWFLYPFKYSLSNMVLKLIIMCGHKKKTRKILKSSGFLGSIDLSFPLR